ncbi:MAG: phytanoyl-CoA dioxygenase [Waddliaceae bacterium]|nr:phytanoyl-CoA dioxygenase [Waddliaceae bacterium]
MDAVLGRQLSKEQLQSFKNNGFLCLPEFISDDDCEIMRDRAAKLVQEYEVPKDCAVFSTGRDSQTRDEYFVNSARKVSFFFDEHAFDENGELCRSKELSINKIGHALHDFDPLFRRFSYQEKIKSLLEDLGFSSPQIIQSMFVFKQAGIGGEVPPHQDSTFIYTDPDTTIGLWFALEDATVDNACLWALPGGHKQPLAMRFCRHENGTLDWNVFDKTHWDKDDMIPLAVPKGSLVILHGHLPHMSYPNRSTSSRNAYTLHCIDRSSQYPKDNWLQDTRERPFQLFDLTL